MYSAKCFWSFSHHMFTWLRLLRPMATKLNSLGKKGRHSYANKNKKIFFLNCKSLDKIWWINKYVFIHFENVTVSVLNSVPVSSVYLPSRDHSLLWDLYLSYLFDVRVVLRFHCLWLVLQPRAVHLWTWLLALSQNVSKRITLKWNINSEENDKNTTSNLSLQPPVWKANNWIWLVVCSLCFKRYWNKNKERVLWGGRSKFALAYCITKKK